MNDPRLAIRLMSLLLLGVGAWVVGYSIWANHSDALSARIYNESPSCRSKWIDPRVASSSQAPPGGACIVETGTIVARIGPRDRGNEFTIVTITPDGTRDNTFLTRYVNDWGRMRPRRELKMQRFIAPGFRRTGQIVAVADDASVIYTLATPGVDRHRNRRNGIVGGMFLFVGMAFAGISIRRS